MRATDPALARTELARSLACTPGAAASPYGRAALEDPAGTVRRLADLTERAWHALLSPGLASPPGSPGGRYRPPLTAVGGRRTR